MKNVKHFLLILGSVVATIIFTKNLNFINQEDVNVLFIFPSVILIFLIFNIVVRSKRWAKGYFTSHWNIFCNKYRSTTEYDISSDLMFDKVKEVLMASGFKVKYADKDRLELIAISKLDLLSWGENIYIDLVKNGDKTILKFCSATLFQIYAWGKNEKNFSSVVNNLEESLII